MGIIERIKEIIFKIKDYDRLESDYCTCLCYFTNNKMSKPNYKIDAVKTVILDSIGEYMDEGYNEATRKAIEWLEENKDKYLYNTGEKDERIPTCSGKMIDEFRAYMEGE
jgi:hypothetical protein